MRRLIMVAICSVGLVAFAQRPAIAVYDGFEGATLSDLWRTDKIAERAIVLQSEHVRAGHRALQITIHPNDPTPEISADHTERDELQERDTLNAHEGEAYAYEFSLFVPPDFPIVHRRLVLAQWKQDRAGHDVTVDNPVIALRYVAGELYITIQSDHNKVSHFSTKAEMRGRWIDFVFHLRQTRTPDGFLRVWMDGKQILDFRGPTAYGEKFGYPPAGRFYFKMGLYRDDMAEPMTVYFDEYRKRPMTAAELQ